MLDTKTISFSKSSSKNKLTVVISGDYATSDVVRGEGARVMQISQAEAVFEASDGDLENLHSDLIALIAVLSFYPVFPEDAFTLNFDFPVSGNVQKALRRPYILPHVTITSPEGGVPYEPLRETVLSYGGGFDSLAAHLIFPDAPLVHESPLGDYPDAVNDIMPSLSDQTYVVKDNMRKIFSVWGLPLWVSVFASSLLFSPRHIISGSEMTGTYLHGGQRYFPRHRNRWYEVFSAIGVNVLPTSFLSEIGNARVVHAHNKMDAAAYCTFIKNKDCGACTKCLRRRAIRAMLDGSEQNLIDDFERSDAIEKFLKVRPLYYGDIFLHAVRSNPRESWLKDSLQDNLDINEPTPFHDRYYPEVFEHFNYPEDYIAQAKHALDLMGLKPFDQKDMDAFRSFEQKF